MRRFAAAAYLGDQKAMMPFFSKDTIQHFATLPTTQYGGAPGDRSGGGALKTTAHLHGIGALNTVLGGLKLKGDQAVMDAPVPQNWDVLHFAGHNGQIFLVKEDGQWKIDAYKAWQKCQSGQKL